MDGKFGAFAVGDGGEGSVRDLIVREYGNSDCGEKRVFGDFDVAENFGKVSQAARIRICESDFGQVAIGGLIQKG
jgi:hypothetical protein